MKEVIFMSLYQEVRPDNFKDIVGNSEVVGAFVSMLRQPAEAQPHAILLKGPSGCGKTTIARILAKEFGASLDAIFELNAANTSGVATIRSVAENAPLLNFGGGPKVYIFDECHEFSGKAQECLLKVIEDNPSHCYFIFCTTDAESLILTIRNRCAEYTVRLLQNEDIRQVLVRACEKKGWEVSSDIVEALVQTSDGSPRADYHRYF
jgi:DNA polymerase-3 subunit gamma/tau